MLVRHIMRLHRFSYAPLHHRDTGNSDMPLLSIVRVLPLILLGSGTTALAEPQAGHELVQQCQQLEHNDPPTAIAFADQLLNDAAVEDPVLRARALACRGVSLAMLGRGDEAIALIDQELWPMLERIDNRTALPMLMQRGGWVFHRSGDTPRAIEILESSLALAEQEQLTTQVPELLGHLAIYQGNAGLHELAIANHRRAIATAPADFDRRKMLPLQYNLGLTLRYQERYSEALEVLTPLLTELETPGMEVRLASLLGIIGGIHRLSGDLDTARQLFERSATLHQQFDNPAEYAAVLRDMAGLSLQEGDTATALARAQQALTLSERAQDFQSVNASMETLVEILADAEDFRAAFELYRELNERQTQQRREQLAQRLTQLEAELGVQRQAVELEQLRSEREMQTLKQRTTLYALFSLGIVAIALLLWQQKHTHRLTVLGRTDGLTGLANRRYLTALLKADPHRTTGQYSVLILADLDHFKHINDRYGHDIGDRALIAVSRYLQQFAEHHGGIVGRWGGEEFCLLLPSFDAETAVAVAKALLQGIASLTIRDNKDETVSISASLGFVPLEALAVNSAQEPWEPAFIAADQLLYRAKNGGRNQAVGLWPTTAELLDHNALEQQIASGHMKLLSS